MRFYQKPHEFYCGIDLHTRKMYCCLVDAAGNKLVHRNIDTRGDRYSGQRPNRCEVQG